MTVTAHVKTFLSCGHRLQNACSQAETRGSEILGSSRSILHTKVEILRLKSRGITRIFSEVCTILQVALQPPPQKTSLIKDFVMLSLRVFFSAYELLCQVFESID